MKKTVRGLLSALLLLCFMVCSACSVPIPSETPEIDASSSEEASSSALPETSAKSENSSAPEDPSASEQASTASGFETLTFRYPQSNGETQVYPVLGYDYTYEGADYNGEPNRYPYSSEPKPMTQEAYYAEERYLEFLGDGHAWHPNASSSYYVIPFYTQDGRLLFSRLYNMCVNDQEPAYRLVSSENVLHVTDENGYTCQPYTPRADGILLLRTEEERIWKMGLMGETPVLLADEGVGGIDRTCECILETDYCVYYVTGDGRTLVGVFIFEDTPCAGRRELFTLPDGVCFGGVASMFSNYTPITNYSFFLNLTDENGDPLNDVSANEYFIYDSLRDQWYIFRMRDVPAELVENVGNRWQYGRVLYPLDPAERAECPWLVPIDEIPLP